MTMTRNLTRCCSLLVVTMFSADVGGRRHAFPGLSTTLASGSYQMTDQNLTRTYRVFGTIGYSSVLVPSGDGISWSGG